MILVDSNILMYAAGKEHPHKSASLAFLEGVANGRIAATIDAEVLQEILHRYRSLRRWELGQQVYGIARTIFREVVPVTKEIADHARLLLDQHSDLMTRDAIHASVVEIHEFDGICSFDSDFDRIKGLRRIEP